MAHPGIEIVRQFLPDRSDVRRPVAQRRAELEALAGTPTPPDGVRADAAVVAGRPAERLTPDRVAGPGTVLYLHGGAYVSGSLATHRTLAGTLARTAGRPVVALDYRLGPEHPFPAAVDDAAAAAAELAAAGPVAVAGDSAGGGLTVATLLACLDAGGPAPVAGWAISPWADLTQSGGSYDEKASVDPLLSREELDHLAELYLDGAAAGQRLASPALADLTGLPPLRIDVGEDEVLLDDARTLARRAAEAGADVELHVWPEMIHVFPAFPDTVVAEAGECLAAAAAFLARQLAADGDDGPS